MFDESFRGLKNLIKLAKLLDSQEKYNGDLEQK
jgi:hypothetical protein